MGAALDARAASDPAGLGPAHSMNAEWLVPDAAKFRLDAARILILEDEFIIAMDLEDLIRGFGCTALQTAASVEAAEVSLSAGPFDLVIADYNLGEQNSEPLIARLREGGVPVILMTGQAVTAPMLSRMGNPVVLQKPVQPRTLREMVEQAISGEAAARP